MDEQTQTQTPPSAPEPVASKSQWPFFIIALILAIIALGLGYLIWEQKNQPTQAATNSVALEAVQTKLAEQDASLHILQAQLDQLQQKSRNSSENSVLRQVVYLVNLANLNLIAGHDVENAQQLLKMAMEKVAQQNNPGLSELQKSLESDYARLTAMASFNVESVILELDNINKRIQSTSLMPNLEFKAADEQKSAAKTTEKLPWYKRLLNSVSGLKDLFIIRHVGANSIPLVSPQEEVFLKENISIKMMQVQWAVIHQKPLIFQRSLKDVEVWLKKYFHNPQSVQSILDSLTKLQSLNVRPDFPGLDNTLKILSDLKQNPIPDKVLKPLGPKTMGPVIPLAPQKLEPSNVSKSSKKPVIPPKASGVAI